MPLKVRRLCGLVLLLLVGGVGLAQAQDPAPKKAAVFDLELIDTSLEGATSGPNPEEARRIALASEELRRRLAASGKYQLVDMTPAAEEIAKAGYLHSCNGCEAAIAQSLGADIAIRGTVQKVSNLILNLNVYLRDARTGEELGGASVDIRGNTDESWLHGVSYMVRNRLAPTP